MPDSENAHTEVNIPCVSFLTSDSKEIILKRGGSGIWKVSKNSVKKFKYCVCVQNRNQDRADWDEGGEKALHRTAFLIGKISDVVLFPGKTDRYLVKFSEYAEINVPEFQFKGQEKNYSYCLGDFGIKNPDDLNWIKMPPSQQQDNKAMAMEQDKKKSA